MMKYSKYFGLFVLIGALFLLGYFMGGRKVESAPPSTKEDTNLNKSNALMQASDQSVAARSMKIGVMDMNRIFTEYYKTKDAQSYYNEIETTANKEMNERMDALKKEMDSINKLNAELEKTDLPKAVRDAKIKLYNEQVSKARSLDREIVEFRSAKQKKLQEQSLGMRKDILNEIMKVVNDQIKIRGFDMVLDKSGLSAGAVPVVLYSRPDLDVSSDVIAILNKRK